MNLAAIVILIVGATLCILFSSDLGILVTSNYGSENSRSERVRSNSITIKIGSSLLLVAALGMSTFMYATGFSLARMRKAEVATTGGLDINSLAAMIDSMAQAAEQLRQNRLITDEDRNVISGQLEELVKTALPKDFLERVDEKYGGTIRNEIVSKYVDEKLADVKSRLIGFQNDLSRKAAAALAWGIATAIVGIGVLFLLIFWITVPEGLSAVSATFYYTARMSLFAIIEVIAFFFLQQYRHTLLDQKYVNNEITNADFRVLALTTAAKVNLEDALSKILIEMSKTERNFALKKGEVSVFDSAARNDLVPASLISQLLDRGRPKSAVSKEA